MNNKEVILLIVAKPVTREIFNFPILTPEIGKSIPAFENKSPCYEKPCVSQVMPKNDKMASKSPISYKSLFTTSKLLLTLRKPFILFYKDFIYLFLQGKGGRKRRRETSVCGCVSCLGTELATLWFARWHSIHWATPARARKPFWWILFHCFF